MYYTEQTVIAFNGVGYVMPGNSTLFNFDNSLEQMTNQCSTFKRYIISKVPEHLNI